MTRFDESALSRRGFIMAGGSMVASTIIGGNAAMGQEKHEEEVSPAEDLMREHGVLKRVLLIYGEIVSRLRGGKEFPPKTLADSAEIIRSFIEDYHEKLEEDYLFPRFKKANKLVTLVDVLAVQHQKGRALTDKVMQLATEAIRKDKDARKTLTTHIDAFIRMYNPHEAREDTILFPAFRSIVSPTEYDALGEDFEKKEHELFGEGGFDKMVDRVAALEKTIGIDDLAKFTPKI